MNIIEAIEDPNLFAPWFKNPATWAAWRSFLRVVFALPVGADDLATFKACTGRSELPSDPASEIWAIAGRRSGKSFTLALIAVFLACFRDYRPYLQPGERGTVVVMASTKPQARTIFRYTRALITRIPMLALMLEKEPTAEAIDLTNDVSIEIGVASFRSVRGYTIVAALCDEIAFWHSDDSANPDTEILDALRPALITIPGAMLLCASNPHASRGALFEAFRRYYGKPGPVLVWKAPTRTMNPSVSQQTIDAAMERDPAAAASEFLAEFRSDLAAFVSRDVVLRATDAGTIERPPANGLHYVAFVDPSGGSADSMTLAIGHQQGDAVIVDALRERTAPFDPESVVEEFAALLRTYGVGRVTGDRYAGEWPRQAFQKRGIEYGLSELPKSGLYIDLLPRLNANTIRLADNPRLVNQLAALERRTSRGGKDSIDHPPNGHDDIANAVAGLAAHVGHRHTTSVSPLWV